MRFDIVPFALPGGQLNEVRFEEPREVVGVEVVYTSRPPARPGLEYMRKHWPEVQPEATLHMERARPMAVGWQKIDDLFTPLWTPAAISVHRIGARVLYLAFKPLCEEMPGQHGCDVTHRRTVAVRLTGTDAPLRAVRVFTRSAMTRSSLRVELHAGSRTPARRIAVSGYNAVVRRMKAGQGVSVRGDNVDVLERGRACFEVYLEHMKPLHRHANDDGHVFFDLGGEAFTISLTALQNEGPVWFAEAGVFITSGDAPVSFEQYRERHSGVQTVARRVVSLPEQSLAGAMNGQPRPHPVAYCFGCKHARQKFWLEPCGDIDLNAWTVLGLSSYWDGVSEGARPGPLAGRDSPRWKNDANARIMFGLDRWAAEARFNDPWPVAAYNQQFRRNEVRVRQKCFAVPLGQSILTGEPASDDTMVALVRFTFENLGTAPAKADLKLSYSSRSRRTINRRLELTLPERTQTDTLVPVCPREKLVVDDDQVLGEYHGEMVLRLLFASSMTAVATADGVHFAGELPPGGSCELLLRIPYVALESAAEIAAARQLDFDRCYSEMARYWRRECGNGAHVNTPDPHLNAFYAGHLPGVFICDLALPDGSGLVNTSVGTCTYGNFTNESAMILEELDLRGLPAEVRRRLAVWTRFQGSVGLKGRFSDQRGVLFGAGGMEQGASYNQHHGWGLWALARHFLHSGDRDWFGGVVEHVVEAAEWIVRQRRQTRRVTGVSRGWERGFLPAGALEDVDDYFYWLSTNVLTWRGLDHAATALQEYGHNAARRFRREADSFRRDLIRGFETARRHSPLVRLRDGRWVPHYPSRLYCRGRDVGWIRETLEGAIYLVISGLYKPESREAGWILDDYLDNRCMDAPYGYVMEDAQTQWFDCGGISPQPLLLATLQPCLDRDEPETFLWIFFNAFAACYRPEIQAMVEHPQPVLGFSNAAPFKTSDQSNAAKWLASMFVYERDGLLHLGRAIPRAWFGQEEEFGAARLVTSFGRVSVSYRPQAGQREIVADVELDLWRNPGRVLLRVRHPRQAVIAGVEIDGRRQAAADACRGDVELPAVSGRCRVSVRYDG